MNYLADTDAISEFKKKKPNTGVLEWFAAQDEETLHVSVITVGEIEKGIAKIVDPVGRQNYAAYLERLVLRFDKRILPIDVRIARRWGKLYGVLQSEGRVLPFWDSLIAATALEYDLTIITRNRRDYAETGALILDVWN